MTLPEFARYVVIGAGVHGLSTAWHLAKELEASGGGSGADIVVLDKTGVGAGPSGIACGVIRNNYFQPAMRELMAHSVEVWESDPEAFHYHPVGYLPIAPEVMASDVARSTRSSGRSATRRTSSRSGRVPRVHGVDLLGLAGGKRHGRPARAKGGYARACPRCSPRAKGEALGVRLFAAGHRHGVRGGRGRGDEGPPAGATSPASRSWSPPGRGARRVAHARLPRSSR